MESVGGGQWVESVGGVCGWGQWAEPTVEKTCYTLLLLLHYSQCTQNAMHALTLT